MNDEQISFPLANKEDPNTQSRNVKKNIAKYQEICYIVDMGNHRAKGGFTPLFYRRVYQCPPDERKEGDTMYVTYQDLLLFCTFIVALVGLCYEIFKDKRK